MAKKVLIVEDTDDIADALKILIEMQGYDAVVAATASKDAAWRWTNVPTLF